MGKKHGKIKVNFIGTNSIDVAGSCTHIEMEEFQILLECGLTQGGTLLEDYRINSSKFPKRVFLTPNTFLHSFSSSLFATAPHKTN